LKLKAKLESRISCFSFKHSVLGAFNMGLIGSTCTALPGAAAAEEMVAEDSEVAWGSV